MHTKGAYLPEIISWMNKEQWSLYVFNNFWWKETLHYKYTVGCSLVEIYEPTNQILQLQIISKGEAARFEKLKNLPYMVPF